MDSQGKRISRALFVIIFISAIGWFAYKGGQPFVLGLDLNGGSALTYKIQTESLPEGSNTEYVPSITERTTSLLEGSATTARQKEDGESQG